MDGIELEILWSNLIGIVSEQAKALQRIAFSPIVREAGDLASGLFDARGRMVAQANTGTPGHINSLAAAGESLHKLFDGKLVPGDIVITNDPWMSAGHFFDITVLCPVYMEKLRAGTARLDLRFWLGNLLSSYRLMAVGSPFNRRIRAISLP